MEILSTQEKGRVPVTVLHIKGSVDAATFQQLETQALELIDGGSRDLLLDLAQVPYMSSAGLRAINVLFNRLNPDVMTEGTNARIRSGHFKSSHFKLLNPTSRVLQVLQMAGYDMFLDIQQDLHQAINSF